VGKSQGLIRIVVIGIAIDDAFREANCQCQASVPALKVFDGFPDAVESEEEGCCRCEVVVLQFLWSSVRSVEESVMLLRHVAEYLAKSGRKEEAEKYLRQATQAQLRADLVRQAASQHEHLSISTVESE
jgi:hypothetical protein